MPCELCGNGGALQNVLIEGVEMEVCADCTKFGKSIVKPRIPTSLQKKKFSRPMKPESEIIERIVDDYSKIIKTAREKQGLKQAEFAKRISEKESLIQKIETGHLMPSILLARKLESSLKIKLVEEFEEKRGTIEKKKAGNSMTLGDMITIKKRGK